MLNEQGGIYLKNDLFVTAGEVTRDLGVSKTKRFYGIAQTN